jgi:hypothetical protein
MKNPRKACPSCGAVYRHDSDFEEHKRLGCKVESGTGESLTADPDTAEPEPETEAETEKAPQE